jgi:hypothetical protein
MYRLTSSDSAKSASMESAENNRIIDVLLSELSKLEPGKIEDNSREKIISLLVSCWDGLEGAGESSMADFKLYRAEDLSWNPPILSLTIERHGGTALGSTRALLQEWRVNLDERTARWCGGKFRQVRPAAARFDTKAAAERVCEAVQRGPDSACDLIKQGILLWNGDKQVSVNHGKVVPNSSYRQTIAGRRKRFRDELTAQMKAIGWELIGYHRSMKFQKR